MSRAAPPSAATADLPAGEYEVIYADPPWRYNHSRSSSRRVENHYPTLPLDEIKKLEVPAAEDAVLYLWATAPKLREALEVLEAWGFEYVSNAVWDKQHIGMGYWFRGQHELLLVGRRGDISPPEPGYRPESVIEAPRTSHSSKPRQVARLLEEAHPDKAKLELFARDARVGWDVWGDETPDSKQATLGGGRR